MSDTKKLSLIAFSGDFDKLTAVFTLATVPLLLDTRLTSSLLSGGWMPSRRNRDGHSLALTG